MLISILLLTIILFIRFGPHIPLRRTLNEHLVESPVTWLSKKQPHDYIFLILVTILLLFGGELLLMFGPEVVIVYAADFAFYIEVLSATALTKAVITAKASIEALRARLVRLQSRALRICRMSPRERTTRRQQRNSRADNDDDDSRMELRKAA